MKRRVIKKYKIVIALIVAIVIIGNGVYLDISLEELKKEYANKHSKFINIDGLNVHYRDEGQGFPIVLIHGTAASLHTWDDWTKELSKSYRVIRMDIPAFGLTGPNESSDYSIPFYTKFVDSFLNKIEIDSCHLGGNSLGGNIAWNYALEQPNKVDKLVLVDASGIPTRKSKPWIFEMAQIPIVNKVFLYYTPRFFIEKNIKQVYENDSKITEELVTRYHNMALREGNRRAFVNRAKLDSNEDSLVTIDKLKKINHQTLLIWGENDFWIPLSHGMVMKQNIPNSRLEVINSSGHVPMEENPEESLKILLDFLNQD